MKILSTVIAISLVSALNPAIAQDLEPQETLNPQIDYKRFAELTAEVESHRSARLVDFNNFLRIAEEKNAIILDTRSANAFNAGHIEGAVNLPFSDFTEEKLAAVLGDNTRPILIYCNNNFSDNRFPIALKSAPLALNIPTFINLYGYGYKNIYELSDVLSIKNERLNWTGVDPLAALRPVMRKETSEDSAPAS